MYLFHVGHNTTYDVASYSHDISKGAINENIRKLNKILHDYLVKAYIKFPTDEEAEQSALKFQAEGFPAKVIYACLDGSHVLVRPPKENKDLYFNRHRTKSLNVLLLVDAFGKFRFVSANVPGSQHDSAIFENTKLYKKLQKLIERNRPFVDAMIAADSAFKRNLAFLLTPFLTEEAATDEYKKMYNEAFCKVRACIERYIGVLKVTFGIMLFTTSNDLIFDFPKSSKFQPKNI